jgi:hypothetical protein
MDIARGTLYAAVALHSGCYVVYAVLSVFRWNNPTSRLVLLGVLPVIAVILLLAAPDERGWFAYYRFSLGLLLPLGPFLGAYIQFVAAGLLAVSMRHGAATPNRIALFLSVTGLALNAFVAWVFASE